MDVFELKKLYNYCPETGQFTRLVKRGRSNLPGPINPRPAKNGYLRLRINDVLYYMHRLAYLYMTGEWPKNDIDHINGVRSDNRWVNLRDATRLQNSNNKKVVVKTPSGYCGVYLNCGKWQARLNIDGVCKSLGYYDTPEEASQVFTKAKEEKIKSIFNTG